jgi:hypothetical protein
MGLGPSHELVDLAGRGTDFQAAQLLFVAVDGDGGV